jgi:hypothetical protein
MVAIVLTCCLLAACGGGEGPPVDDERPSSTTARRDDDRMRAPLSFRPVLAVRAASDCTAAAGPDTLTSSDRSVCYSLGTPEVVVTRYGAKAGATSGAQTDGGAVDVTLRPGDLRRFNSLAQSCFSRSVSCPTRQLAVVFGGVVRSVPTVQEPEFSGSISITGTDGEMRALLRDMER